MGRGGEVKRIERIWAQVYVSLERVSAPARSFRGRGREALVL